MATSTKRRRVPLLVTLLLASGCAKMLEGNEPREVDREVPQGFGAGQGVDAGQGGTSSVAQEHWDILFSDPQLGALIDEALENNQELNIQMQEVIIARAEVGGRKGEYLPSLGAGAGVGVEKVGDRTSQGVSDEAHGVPVNMGDFRFGLMASWEIDVWGKLRNAAKAANLRYLATVEAQRFLTTEIVAEIARSYYELIAIDRALDVLEGYVELTAQALEAVRLKKEAARATELAVQRFEAELYGAEGRVFEYEQQRVIVENRINFLVGRYPQKVARGEQLLDEAALARVVNTGVPSELLDNRTDVRRAELELEAAKLDVKSARAKFFPSLSLEAGVGYESFNAAHLVATPGSLAYGVAGGLAAPLLNRAAIKAEYRTANAMQVTAVFEYEQTLLRAFTEVINELARLQNLARRHERVSSQVDTLESAIEVSNVLYWSAHADYMEVLLTRRDAIESQLDLIEIELSRMEAMVGLYQALGGGWR